MPSQGPIAPSTARESSDFGGETAWTDKDNIKVDDGNYATATIGTVEGTSSYTLIGSDFESFSVPGGATILGITVSVKMFQSNSIGADCKDISVALWGLAAPISDDKMTETSLETAEETRIYGGAADVWGAVLDAATVNGGDFGFGIRFENASENPGTVSVGYMEMTVTYVVADLVPATQVRIIQSPVHPAQIFE